MLSGQRREGPVDDKKLDNKEISMIIKSSQKRKRGLIITSVQTEACVVRQVTANGKLRVQWGGFAVGELYKYRDTYNNINDS